MSERNGSAIEGLGLHKAYGGVLALEDATFCAAPGEVHALVGENGAGKSTMIKALAGVIRPDRGRVLIGGEEVRLRSPEDALRRGVATVFQELTLLPRMTVAENLLMGREPRGRLNLIRRREFCQHRLMRWMKPLDPSPVRFPCPHRSTARAPQAVAHPDQGQEVKQLVFDRLPSRPACGAAAGRSEI